MDICAIDVMCGKDGQDYIIELNGTACGFLAHRWEEDTSYVLEIASEKIEEIIKEKVSTAEN